jgi:hypothetical protein
MIGKEGAEKIAEALITNKTLTKLIMPGNQIREGASKMSEFIQVNQTIICLSI